MQIRNLRLDVSTAANATTANTANNLTGIGSLHGKAFQSVRVKQDESGFETTYKAEDLARSGNYSIALGDTDAFLVFDGDATVTLSSNATAALPVSANVGFTSTGGTLTFAPDSGVTIVKDASLSLVSTGPGAVQQAKKIAANTWLLFGSLVPA